MTKLIPYLERVYPWLLFAPVILPVIIWGQVIYPYLVPKTLLFYALSLLSIASFLILAAYGRPFYWTRLVRREAWIPAALLAVAYLASLFGIDFYRSFWSLFIRGDGLLMFTCATGSFYLILLSADRTFSNRLMRGATAIGSFVAVYGVGEWLLGGGRIGSLLGNAAFFAGYLGITFFVTLMVSRTLAGGWRTAARWSAGLQVLAIVLTATRGTILALAVAGLAYLAYLAYRGEGKAKKTSAWILGALILFGGLFFMFRGQLAHAPFAPVARIASIGVSDPDIANRLFIWKNMLTQIEQSPWIGVGAEHIDVLFNRFYDPTQISEQWFDRSHNAFLDYFAEFGIAGFILYLMLIGSFFVAARRFWKRGESGVAGLTALLVLTYAVQNFFVFDTISSFWLILALLAVLLSASREDAIPEVLPVLGWMRPGSWLVALVLLYLIVPLSVEPARAAYDLLQAYKYQLVDVPQEVAYLSRGESLNTYGNLEYGYEAYDMYANNQATALTGENRVLAYQAAYAILKANFDRYPYDARTALYLAQVLTLAPQGGTVDPNLVSDSIARAIKESPRRYQSWYILANLSITNANQYPPQSAERVAGYSAAMDILNRYIGMVPTLSEPHFVLAQLLYASGRAADAAAEAAKGKQYYTSDLETAKRAVVYYETVLDLPDAALFLKEVLYMEPTNAGAAQDLAKIQAYEQSQK
ncbi:O-antigen ligase family protein [Patescibacteria group bacterium]|nr:O-antigen ligase family protein [Patescibacteria group bacterium]